MKLVPSIARNTVLTDQKIDSSCYETEFYQKQIKNEKNYFWFEHRNRIILDALRGVQSSLANEPVDMIEIGCGVGTVISFLIQSGFRVSGADLYPEGLEECGKRLRTPLYRFDVRDIPYENKWNVIGCFDVLEHIHEDELALRNIHKALTARGHILITVPAIPFLYSNNEGTHKRRYSKRELTDKLTKSGFIVEKISYFYFLLFPLFAASRILKKIKNEPVFTNEDFEIHPILNRIFSGLCGLEFSILKSMPLPIGSSIIAVARKVS